jgi:hypothetical protein
MVKDMVASLYYPSRIGNPICEVIARVCGRPRVNVRLNTWAQKG